jgi:dCMP deaminase
MLGPREKRYSWDDAFMIMALSIAQRSADPSTQVGCCLVDNNNRLIGAGYNGPPRGICPGSMPWDKEGPPEKTKYSHVLHAEANALKNAIASTDGAKCYVTLQCCNTCAMSLIQAGIKEVIYFDDKYKDMWFTKLALDMFSRVDIAVRKHKWSNSFASVFSSMAAQING